MNTRIADIAREVASGRQASLAVLAQHFGVSQRTVRNDLKSLNAELGRLGCSPIEIGRGGTLSTPDDLSQALPQLAPTDLYEWRLTPPERVRAEALMLANYQGYLRLSNLADALLVSRGTIINDLEHTKGLIGASGLTVVSHPSRGLRVDGPESVRRLFLLRESDVDTKPDVSSSFAERPSLGDADPAGPLAPSGKTTTTAGGVFSPLALLAGNPKVISKIVTEQETGHARWLTGESFKEVVRYLRIMVSRCGMGEPVEPQDLAENSWFPMALDIVRFVSQYCDIEAGRDEALALSSLLSRMQYLRQEADQDDAPLVQLVTRQFIARISEELGEDLNSDFDLFEMLASHLESTMRPVPVEYPDTPVIRRAIAENQSIINAVRRRDAILRSFAGRELTDLETGYIALHVCAAIERKHNRETRLRIAIACNGGIGTSQLLLEKLRRHFDFDIVQTVASHEVKDLKPSEVDMVVTTVPLDTCRIESVHVSPLLDDNDVVRVAAKADALRNSRNLPTHVDDEPDEAKNLICVLSPIVHEVAPEDLAPLLIRRIRRAVRHYFEERSGAGADEVFAPYLHQLLIPSHILLDERTNTWEEAVRVSAEPLLSEGYIEPRYIEAMIENIRENGPYVVLSPGFAMPHEGLNKGAVETGMSFVRLAEPVSFGAGDFDPVEFVCCLAAADKKTHLKALFSLVNMIRDPKFKQELHDASSPSEITGILERYEYGTVA